LPYQAQDLNTLEELSAFTKSIAYQQVHPVTGEPDSTRPSILVNKLYGELSAGIDLVRAAVKNNSPVSDTIFGVLLTISGERGVLRESVGQNFASIAGGGVVVNLFWPAN
jgi:hypothetical protein